MQKPPFQFSLRKVFWWATVVGVLAAGVKISLPAFDSFLIEAHDALARFSD
jgi:hypothetical protein